MQGSGFDDKLEQADGIIQAVDVPRRELLILREGAPWVFDVAPDCAIWLHGERVKLRLLQPLDHVCVVYAGTPTGPKARAIRVE